jgi:hypothetical protein
MISADSRALKPGLDSAELAREVDGRIMSAFVRAKTTSADVRSRK